MKKNSYKIIILLVVICILLFISVPTIGRYIYNAVNDHLLESQNFYFNSSILSVNGNTYNINNWDGVNEYQINIDVNSKKNEFISTDVNVNYDIVVNCPDTVRCTTSKNKGIIDKTIKTDSYIISVIPIGNFYSGDQVVINTEASSTFPYNKTIKATYIVGIEDYGFSYNIIDSVGSKYLTLELTNSKPYYVVNEAFSTYQVGDQVSLNEYLSLSDEFKDKCVSCLVNIAFDPNLILLDMNSSVYLNKISETTIPIDNYDYVNGLSFKVAASSNEKIQFYKKNVNQLYDVINSTIVVSVDN